MSQLTYLNSRIGDGAWSHRFQSNQRGDIRASWAFSLGLLASWWYILTVDQVVEDGDRRRRGGGSKDILEGLP